MSPLVLKLVEPDGTSASLAGPTLDGNRVVLGAPSNPGAGSYVLSWRVISADGHPVGGAVVYSVGHATKATGAVEAVDWPLRAAIWLSRLFVYFGLFFGVGGAFFVTWIAGGAKPAQRAIAASIIAGIAATLPSLGLLGADALDLPLSSLSDTRVWATALSTSYAVTAVLASIAMLLAFTALLARRANVSKSASTAAILGVGLALAASGHASTADPQWLTWPAVFVHAIAVAFWIGALAPLAVLSARGDGSAPPALARFSALIPYVLAALLAAGLALAVVQVRHFGALVSTNYGRVLLAKLALVAILLLLAALNRWRLTGAVLAGDGAAERRFVRSVAAEILLVTAIFGCVALWRFTPPPRALAAAAVAAPPISIHLHGDKAMAQVTISPGRAGPVGVSAFIVGGDLEPLDAKEVTLAFSMPSAGIEPIRRDARKIEEGQWRVDGLSLPVAGTWDVSVEILISDFESVTLKSEMTLH